MSQSEERGKLSQSIAQMMPQIIQGVHIGFLAQKKLTHTQFFALAAIHSQKRPAMSTLADNFQVSMPTMTGIIERLVKGGYVKRIAHPKDRRQILVELTPLGSQIITGFQRAAMARWQKVLVALDSGDVEHFQSIVNKLLKSLEQKGSDET